MKWRLDFLSVYSFDLSYTSWTCFDLYGCVKQICVCVSTFGLGCFLIFALARDVNVMLEGCSLECCHTFRQLFRVVNSIKKFLLGG
jgi:hypothetical protein